MRRVVTVNIVCLTILLNSAGKSLGSDTKEFLEYSDYETLCQTEMAHLDRYAIEVQNQLKYTAYVIVYGGRSGTARHEIKQRRARIRRYLVQNRGLESDRVLVVDGGFREKVTVELWLVGSGCQLPKPTPTVLPKDVKYKRTKLQFNCSTFY